MAPTDPIFTPPVVATMVVHEPGDWFAETLAALAGQDYPGLQTLFLLNGTPDDPAAQQARDLIATHVPGAVVRHTGANVGYAAACNAVLSLVEGEGGLFCFLHDDVALAPDAVSRMVEELHRSNAGVVGPKLVHWDDPRMIQSVGTAVDRLGVAMPLADDGEIDQEQHDSVQDVFVLSSACLLVRSDLFRRVGGFPTDSGAAGTDLDFCWRVHLQGARVVVVPASVVMHRESMLERTDADMADMEREQHESRLATVLTMTSLRYLPSLVVETVLVTVVHAIVVLLTGSPRRAIDEIRALLRLPFTVGTVRSRRAAVQRVVSDAEVRALQVRGSAHLVGYLRRRDRRRGLEQAQAAAAGDREATPRSAVVLWSVLVAVLVIGSRDLLLNGPAEVGQIVPLVGSPGDLARSFMSGWWNAGLGQSGAVPTGIGLTALSGWLFLGHMGLVRTVAVVGAPLIGWLGVWRFASVLTTRAARVAATLAYAAVPLAWTSMAAGRWGGLATYALFPWVAHGLRRLVGHVPIMRASTDDTEAFGDLARREWWRTFATVAMVLAVLVAFEPGALLALLVMAVVWALVTAVNGAGVEWSSRWLALPALAVFAALVLNLPWTGAYVRSGWWEAVTGVPVEGGRGLELLALARFQMGDFHFAAPSVLLVAPVLGAMFVVRGSRFPWALRGAMLSTVGLLLVLLDDKAMLPAHLPEPAVMLVPVAFGLAVCAGAMGAGLSVDLRGGRLSWRQPLGALVALAFAVGLVPTAVNAVPGNWSQPRTTLATLLRQLPGSDDNGNWRTLFIGDPRALPGAPSNVGWGIAQSVVNGRAATLDEQWEVARTRTGDEASRAVRGIVRGTTARAGRMLGPLGVRYVVVPVIDGGLSTRSRPVAEPVGLIDAMARQLDFRRRYSSPDLAIFENAAWLPVASVLAPTAAEAAQSAGAESVIANDLSGSVAVLPGLPGRTSVRGDVPAGTLHLSVPYSTRWTVTGADGSRRAPSPAFGLTNAYDLSSGAGSVTVSYEGSILMKSVVVLVILLWLATLRVALPRRRRRPRGVGSVVEQESAIVMGERR